MTREEFLVALDALIAEKHLLKHPFYQLWSQGRLTTENLRESLRIRRTISDSTAGSSTVGSNMSAEDSSYRAATRSPK